MVSSERRLGLARLAWPLVLLGFASLPHLPWLPLWILGAAGLLVAWRIVAAFRHWRMPSAWIRVPLVMAVFAAVAVQYHGFSGVDAGSALLLIMGALKLLETNSKRDRSVLIYIASFLIFAAFLREQSVVSVIWLAMGFPLVAASLMQTTRMGRVHPPGILTARLLPMLGWCLPFAILCFLLFPRLAGPVWQLPGSQTALTGLSEQMTPGDIAELGLSDALAFRVRFLEAVPETKEMYWRGPVLERFDGRTWRMDLGPRVRLETPEHDGSAYAYEVILEPHGHAWLLALDTPVGWDANGAFLARGHQLTVPNRLMDRRMYSARSVPDLRPAGLDRPGPYNEELPAWSSPAARRLAEQLGAGRLPPQEYLERVLDWFRAGEFTYTLSPPRLGRQPVDQFLFETRQGFCEHYASAFAVLVRAAGLPSRVVLGYQGAERNPFGDHWIVRQARAHAWTEVWLDGAWTRFDPTAAVAPLRIEEGPSPALNGLMDTGGFGARIPLMERLVMSWDAVNAAWDRWVLAFGPDAQNAMLHWAGFANAGASTLAMLLVVAGTLFAVLVLASAQRRRQPVDPALKAYRIFCQSLARRYRHRQPWEGPWDYAHDAARHCPELAADVQGITTLYVRARYESGATPVLMDQLRRQVRQFRRRVRGRA